MQILWPFYLFIYAQGKMDTETNFVVTVGLTTKVDHQTTSKIKRSWSVRSRLNFGVRGCCRDRSMCFSHLGVFLISVKPFTTENTENKTIPKICKITVCETWRPSGVYHRACKYYVTAPQPG